MRTQAIRDEGIPKDKAVFRGLFITPHSALITLFSLYSPAVNTPEIKQTPLHAWHVAQGAKMAPFAGFSMPIQYSGIRQEHEAVRTRAGLFDVSHMGNFRVRGPGALAYLQRMTVNNVAKLAPGDVQYSAFCREDGGVIDDILVYCVAAADYMIVVNAANIAKDWNWCADHHKKWEADCEMENVSEELSIVSLQGPEAEAILRKVAPDFDGAMKTYQCAMLNAGGVEMLVGRTGYTGEDGFEFYPKAADTEALWKLLIETGAPHGILPIGLAARDTLRLESGYSLYGHELTDAINPLEAGLGWITALDSEDKQDFLGRDALLSIRASGSARKLTGLVMDELAIPREGCAVWHNGRAVGAVTSGTLSPTSGKGIALALVEPEAAARDTALQVEIRGGLKPARAVPRTFYKRTKSGASDKKAVA
jgi:aminomethyltransferase